MPRYPAAYDPYSGGDTIGDLIRQRGDIYAQNALQSGQIWGQGIQNIAGTLGQGFQAWEQGRAEEKKQKALSVQAQAVNDAIDRKDFPALLKILPPDKAKTIIEGLKAHDPDEVSKFKDPTDVFVAGAKMNEALPEANRPKAWALQVQSWTQKGYITPDQAEQYADPSNAARIAKLKDKPKEEKGPQVVGGALVTPEGKVIYKSETEAKAAQTQNIGGRVKQWNPESGRYDIDLGASEAALTREAAGVAKGAAGAEKTAEKEKEVSSWIDTLEQGGNLSQIPANLRGEVNAAFQKKTGHRALASSAESEKATSLSGLSDQIDQIEAAAKDVEQSYGAQTGPLKEARDKLNKLAGSVIEGDIGVSIPTPFGAIDLSAERIAKATNTDPKLAKLWQLSSSLATIARAQGEKGTLSDQDVNRVKALMPKLGDTAEIRAGKIRDLRAIVERGQKGLGQAGSGVSERDILKRYGY